MTVFLDSSALIAYHRVPDGNHATAQRILNELDEKNTSLLTSSHVLEEVVTYIAARNGSEKAYQAARQLLQMQKLDLVIVGRPQIDAALEVLRKYRGLSLCDAVTVVLMNERSVGVIVSFDSDFDRFKHVKRLW